MELDAHHISFPPYICTAWNCIASITLASHPSEDYEALTITMKSGITVHLPELLPEQETAIFNAYTNYLRQASRIQSKKARVKVGQASNRHSSERSGSAQYSKENITKSPQSPTSLSKNTPINGVPSKELTRLQILRKLQEEKALLSASQLKKLLESSSGEALSQLAQQAMQQQGPLPNMFLVGGQQQPPMREEMVVVRHDPSAAKSNSLPKEMLRKIRAFAKNILAQGELSAEPQAVSGCNCPHCQIARAIEQGVGSEELRLQEGEVLVEEDELKFSKWSVLDLGNERFNVTDPSDKTQSFIVEIKPTLQCSCGKNDCEHIVTILENY